MTLATHVQEFKINDKVSMVANADTMNISIYDGDDVCLIKGESILPLMRALRDSHAFIAEKQTERITAELKEWTAELTGKPADKVVLTGVMQELPPVETIVTFEDKLHDVWKYARQCYDSGLEALQTYNVLLGDAYTEFNAKTIEDQRIGNRWVMTNLRELQSMFFVANIFFQDKYHEDCELRSANAGATVEVIHQQNIRADLLDRWKGSAEFSMLERHAEINAIEFDEFFSI